MQDGAGARGRERAGAGVRERVTGKDKEGGYCLPKQQHARRSTWHICAIRSSGARTEGAQRVRQRWQRMRDGEDGTALAELLYPDTACGTDGGAGSGSDGSAAGGNIGSPEGTDRRRYEQVNGGGGSSGGSPPPPAAPFLGLPHDPRAARRAAMISELEDIKALGPAAHSDPETAAGVDTSAFAAPRVSLAARLGWLGSEAVGAGTRQLWSAVVGTCAAAVDAVLFSPEQVGRVAHARQLAYAATWGDTCAGARDGTSDDAWADAWRDAWADAWGCRMGRRMGWCVGWHTACRMGLPHGAATWGDAWADTWRDAWAAAWGDAWAGAWDGTKDDAWADAWRDAWVSAWGGISAVAWGCRMGRRMGWCMRLCTGMCVSCCMVCRIGRPTRAHIMDFCCCFLTLCTSSSNSNDRNVTATAPFMHV
eukprot:364583-Chlamydomonas_euryale.AAC.2